jgi:hypothetical protein
MLSATRAPPGLGLEVQNPAVTRTSHNATETHM